MNQIKIGAFIAERRKMKNLTQKELADLLFVTDKAVSKWETGKSIPDSSIMLELCRILEISVNDLLNGEVSSLENYNKDLENKLVEMVKEKEEGDRRLLALEIVIGVLSVAVLLISAVLSAYLPLEREIYRVLVLLPGFALAIFGFAFAIIIEQTAGYYECKHCGHRYVPTNRAFWFSMHAGRTRYLKCPSCKKKSWQRKRISKD